MNTESQAPALRIHELEKALRYSVRFLNPADHDVDYILGVLQGGGAELPAPHGNPPAGGPPPGSSPQKADK